MKYISIEKADGWIIKVEGGRFQTIVFLGKKKVPDILTGKLFRNFSHVIQEIGNIVFVAVNGTLFEVTDFSGFLKL